MAMTWKDIRLATLQKMFSADGTDIPTDESVQEYLNGMPQVANEALMRIYTSGLHINRTLTIDKEDSALTNYNLRNIAGDLYAVDKVYYEDYQTNNYIMEGSTILLKNPGRYTIFYFAYPPEFSMDTADDYEVEIDKEVAVILPLYMASELYKDDDNGIATSYRNEFEIAVDQLRDNHVVTECITSESGWV